MMHSKIFSLKALALLGLGTTCVFFSGAGAQAIDIGSGPLQGLFNWDNPAGPPAAATPTYEVTVGTQSFISVALEDGYVAGDQFELLLNGNPLTVTSSGSSADGFNTTNPILGAGLTGGPFFYGIWKSIALAPGLNIFTINTTAYAPAFTDGGAFVYFSPVSVPGPLPVLGAMAALGYSRRLRAKIKSSSTTLPG